MQGLLCRPIGPHHRLTCLQPTTHAAPHTNCNSSSCARRQISAAAAGTSAADDWGELPAAAKPASSSNAQRPISSKSRGVEGSSRNSSDGSSSTWYEPAHNSKPRGSRPDQQGDRSSSGSSTRHSSRRDQPQQQRQQRRGGEGEFDHGRNISADDRWSYSSSSSSSRDGAPRSSSSSGTGRLRDSSTAPADTGSSSSRPGEHMRGRSSNGGRSLSSTMAAASKKKEKKAAALAPSNQPCCYGCGAPLQTSVASAAGYVSPDKYQLKRKHKQLNKVLCVRCSGLCNGAMIPAVEDFTQKAWAQQQAALLQQQQQQQTAATSAVAEQVIPADSRSYEAAAAAGGDGQLELLGKLLVTPEQLRQKISEVRSVKALVVLLVDLLDASGTLMSKVRDMVGNNPIVLVGTKMDLLPHGCKPKEVAEWLAEAAARRRLLVTSAHLVSSHTGEGIAAVTSKVCRERKGRDVFVVGAANVGKSAFVRAMLKEMSSLTGGNFDAAAMATSRYLPVESAMPGTTLGLIPLQAFETGGTLYDTPGVHLHHRIPHMLTPGELRLLHPRKRLTAFNPPTPLELWEAEQEDEADFMQPGGGLTPSRSSAKPKAVSATYLWSGLVRVDVMSGPPGCSLVFYGPKTMRVYALPLLQHGQEVDIDVEGESTSDEGGSSSDDDGDEVNTTGSSQTKGVLFCKQSVDARGGLVPHTLVVKSPIPTAACLADVAVSGLPGWVGVYAPFSKQDIVLRVWVPRGVEVFLRPPLPSPPPPKPHGSDEPEELVEIGDVLDRAELDQEWEAHKEGLELNKQLSAQDEEILKMLMFGDEAAGIQGIVDVDEEQDESEEVEQQFEQLQPVAVRAEQLIGSNKGRKQQQSRPAVDESKHRADGVAAGDGSDEVGDGWVKVHASPEELGLPGLDGGSAASSGRQRRRRTVSSSRR